MSRLMSAPAIGGTGMTKPKKDRPLEPKQVNFRVPGELYARLEALADGFGQDVSNFLRLVLNEQVPAYERRLERIRRGEAMG